MNQIDGNGGIGNSESKVFEICSNERTAILLLTCGLLYVTRILSQKKWITAKLSFACW